MILKTKEEVAVESMALKTKVEVAADKVGLTRRLRVINFLDMSGSAKGLYQSGMMKLAMLWVTVVGFHYDDDGQIPLYGFSDQLKHFTDVTLSTLYDACDNLVNWFNSIIGGTYYHIVIKKIIDYLNEDSNDPVLAFIYTDGEPSDIQESIDMLKKIANKRLFIVWIGLGTDLKEGPQSFLQKYCNNSIIEEKTGGMFGIGGKVTTTSISNSMVFIPRDLIGNDPSPIYEKVFGRVKAWLETNRY